TPRRPRPKAPAKPATQETEVKSKPLSRKSGETLSEPPVPMTEASESGAATLVQRSSMPEEVETEIGTLPADLWQLIDQEIPKQVEQPSPATVISAKTAQPGKKPETISMPLEPFSGSAAPQTRSPELSKSAVIQRTVSQETAATNEAASESEDTSENGGSETQEVDTDELARKVYSQIKRRLSVEWERFRQRF
ncbi:MAG: hypothetical protein MUO76_09615, partial [Anaerolineaceae bacterium]|nr:hypothetical protein [Anaerolineaceae bacterium]